jgi:hypothetical protein
VSLCLPLAATAQLTHDQLREIAQKELADGLIPHTDTKLTPREGTLFWQLGHAQLHGVSNQAVLDQFRVEIVRKSTKGTDLEGIFAPAISNVEPIIAEELDYLQKTKDPQMEKKAEFAKRIELEYSSVMRAYAESRGLKERHIEQKPFKVCKVLVKTESGAPVQMIGNTRYLLITTSGNIALTKDLFVTYANGTENRIAAGKYVYRVGDTGELRTADISVDGEIIFSP